VSRSRSRLRRLDFFFIFKCISHHSAPDLDSLTVQERELRDRPFRSPAGASDSCPWESPAPPSGQGTRTPTRRGGPCYLLFSLLICALRLQNRTG
jgi:hypothetical protein